MRRLWQAARDRLQPGQATTLDDTWIVVDVETAGLDPRRDALLAIGAVTVRDFALQLAPACDIRLRQHEASTSENILVHGITGGEQLAGRDPADAMQAWHVYAGRHPRIAYHAAFDRLALERASRTWGGGREHAAWLDLAVLAPMLVPHGPGFNQPLDAWLSYFDIPVYARHNALADAYATAQLWLALLPSAQAQHLTHLRHLARRCRDARWFERRHA